MSADDGHVSADAEGGPAGRPRAKDPRPERTRIAILTALERLAVSGREATVNAVLREAGISRATFYAHFSSLDDLAVTAVIERFSKIGLDGLLARERGMGHRAASRATVRGLIEQVLLYRGFYLSALDWRVSSRVQETAAKVIGKDILRHLHRITSQGEAPPGTPPPEAHADTARFISGGMLHMFIAWLREEEPGDLDLFTERVLAQLPEWMIGPPEDTAR